MADVQKLPDGFQMPLGSVDELRTAWTHFRCGNVVLCPMDRSPVALAVDASSGMYRFVCTMCGAASTWFESGPNGIRIPGPPADHRPPED
jgi:hypothetical protein